MPQKPIDTAGARGDLDPGLESPADYTQFEFHQIFKHMVADELKAGPLPYGRRRKLMRYAEQIRIKPFQAALLIAQAEREAGYARPLDVSAAGDSATAIVHPERWPIWFKLTAALIIAVMVDLVIIRALGW